MRFLHRAARAATAGALVAGVAVAGAGAAAAAGNPNAPGQIKHTERAVCANLPPAGYARCNAHVRTDADAVGHQPGPAGAAPAATANPNVVGNNGGYDPSYLQSAYNTAQASASAGYGQTVAIVDAYNDPGAESDMASYRSFFHLPACTTANGCFRKVNQFGGTSYPVSDTGWGEEISLDLDMVSAVCPNCHILLVEASDNSLGNLGAAVNEAVRLGANVVSNSYGGGEYSSETQDANTYYNHPGVAVVASTGDSGYGVEFPAAAPNVTAVGGTSLYQNSNTGSRNGSESAWSGAGSGCSAYVGKPAWQTDTGCSNRAVADVSAVADPNTGVWVYDAAIGGWSIFGGTSAASPIVGSVFALGGAASSSSSQLTASWPYGASSSNLFDVTSGSNGTCAVGYLCTAGAGYDGPTGLGTPNGTGAFVSGTSGGSGGGTSTPPGAPTLLSASASSGSVSLSWQAGSPGTSPITGYNVYRNTTSGAETLYRSGVTSTSYTDTAVSAGTTYYYEVTAVSSAGEGARSNELSATTPATTPPPGTPTLTAGPAYPNPGVNLSWTVPNSSDTSYRVYRGTRSGRESGYVTLTAAQASCNGTSCSYHDANTISGATYWYQVAAVNSTGTGPRSAQVSARAT